MVLLGGSIGPESPIVHARFFPEHTRDLTRIDASLLPPSSFVDDTMNRAVVDSTERHCGSVAYFAAECAWLHVAQMMRVRRLAAAHKTGLLGDESDMTLSRIRRGSGKVSAQCLDRSRSKHQYLLRP